MSYNCKCKNRYIRLLRVSSDIPEAARIARGWSPVAAVVTELHKKEKHGYTTGGELHGK
jgi:hypothetical protein